MSFNEDLSKFKKELTDIIKKFEDDNNELFTPSMGITFEKEIKSYSQKAEKAIDSYNKLHETNIKRFDLLFENHNKLIDQINIEYETCIKKINDLTYNKIDALKQENSDINLERRKKTTEIELEVSFNKNKNDNNVKLFESEYKNSISRFDYQLDNSKVAYNETVNYFNNDLKNQLNIENNKFDTELNDYTLGTENIKNKYRKNILKESKELDSYINKFNDIQASQKEQKYIETVDLNARIRNLVNEKNQKIVAERIDYSKDQNVNKIEHDMKKRESLVSAQQTSKEFVLNMDKLNSQRNNIKDSYQKEKAKLEKNLQFDILLNHKEEEENIRNYIYDSSKDSDKKILKLQKSYQQQRNVERAKTKIELTKTEKNYKRNLAKNNFDRNILDINRNYDLKINNEKENADNKYFQALNNIDENDFNFKTKIHNNNYNINANILKLDNAIKTIKTDSVFEKENADHQIEIQRLNNELKKTNLELNTLVEIQEKITNYEKLRHDKCIKFLTINNLLEIEKCKTLAEFNTKNYNQNVENAKKILELSKRKLHMENSKFSALSDLKIEQNNILADKTILENNNTIDYISLKQEKEIEQLDRKLVYDTDVLINKLLQERFKLELTSINKLITTFITLIKELEHSITYLIDSFFDSIVFRPEYISVTRGLMYSVFKLVYEYYVDLINDFHNIIANLIESRFSFEKDFKYKSNYEELMVEYNTIFEELYSKKDRLEEDLRNLSIEIDLKNQAIFAIKNQISMSRNPSNNQSIGPVIKKSISELRKQQKYNESELYKLVSKQNDTNKKLTDLTAEIARVREENEKKENEISAIQSNGSISYFNMKKDYINCFINITNQNKIKLFGINDDDVSVTTYEKLLNERRDEILAYDNYLFGRLYTVMNKFSLNAVSNFEKTDKITKAKFNDDMNRLLEKANTEYNIIKEKIQSDNRLHDNKLDEVQKKINNTNHYYAIIEKNFTNEQAYTSKNSLILKEKIEQQFYSELYAIRDNQAMIVKDYEETIARYTNESRNLQDQLVSKMNQSINRMDEDLKNFIRQKNEYIKELPEKIKLQEITLTKDTKEINKNIQKQKIIDREEYLALRSEYFKNLAELQANYSVKLKTYNYERHHKLKTLKRRHHVELRRI